MWLFHVTHIPDPYLKLAMQGKTKRGVAVWGEVIFSLCLIYSLVQIYHNGVMFVLSYVKCIIFFALSMPNRFAK